MPKKRKNNEDIIERYRNKIRKLEDNQRRKRRRILIESSSDSGEESLQDEPPPEQDGEVPANTDADQITPNVSTTAAQENNTPSPECPELDPEVLLALGEPTNNTPKFGEKIHYSLAQRWDPILLKGLSKDEKENLLKQYLVPENCTLLQAPKLNEEVSAAISEAARHRDKRKELDQQQLGVGISAINNALTVLLTSDKKIEAIKIFSDGCRILSDLHSSLTHSRKTIINYSLAKPFLNIVQDSERDNTLYGQKLAEKIKASKAIEKQGLSIKKATKIQKSVTNEQTGSSSRPYQQQPSTSYQGNWSGPSSFHQNRGGRRGLSRRTYYIPTNRRLPLNQPQQSQSNATAPSRTRTPATRN